MKKIDLTTFLATILTSLFLVCSFALQAQTATYAPQVKVPTYKGSTNGRLHTTSSATQNEYLGGGTSSSSSSSSLRGSSSSFGGGSSLHPVGSVSPISSASSSAGVASAPYSEPTASATPVMHYLDEEEGDSEHEHHEDPNPDMAPIGDGMAIMLLFVLAYFAKNIIFAIARMQKK